MTFRKGHKPKQESKQVNTLLFRKRGRRPKHTTDLVNLGNPNFVRERRFKDEPMQHVAKCQGCGDIATHHNKKGLFCTYCKPQLEESFD